MRLEISVHHRSPEYAARAAEIQRVVADWQQRYRFPVRWRTSFARWERVYRGFAAEMQPYADGNPRQSWQRCRSRWCPQILGGRIYKCPQIAYLPMQDEKFGLGPEWSPI